MSTTIPLQPAEKPLAISVPAMAHRLGISRGKAYQLAKRKDVPSFELDGRVLVLESALASWVEAQLRRKEEAK